MKKALSLVLSFILMTALFTGCSSGSSNESSQSIDEVVVLKLAHQNNPNHPYQIGAEKFKELVEERTNGKVEIEIFHSGQLGNERELIEQCSLGSVDFIISATAPFANFVEDLMVFDLPFLFRDRDHAYKVLDGEVGESILGKLDNQGMIGLGYWENGFRHVSNSKKEVKTPEDLEGLKIRLMENQVHLSTFDSIGALPTPMAWGEVFTALQQGTIDGMENSPVVYVTANLFEVQKYYSLTGHFYSPSLFAANKDKLSGLPSDIQDVILQAADEARDYEREMHEKLDEENLEILKEKGMIITEVDTAPFREKCTKLYDEYRTKLGAELIDQIIDTK